MRKWTKKLFYTLCLLSLLMLAACSDSSKETTSTNSSGSGTTSKGEKTMYLGLTNPPGTLNPINAADVSSQIVTSILFETLYDLDDKLQFQPKLAESLESKDNQNYVLKLNPKAKWTDGQPFTAEDIVFTLQLMANPKVASTGLKGLSVINGLDNTGILPAGQKDITGLKVVDDHTLNIKTKNPIDPNYLKEQLGVNIRFLPKHVLKDVDPEQLQSNPFMQNPNVTNGAFKLVKFAKDQYVEFAANKDYYRGTPKLDKLFFKVLPSANLVAQLQTGEIQMTVPSVGPIAAEDYDKVKNMSTVNLVPGTPIYPQFLYYNVKTLSDVKARQAIAYAIDRKTIVDKLYKGQGEVNDGPFSTVHPYYNKNMTNYDYDPKKAKELLKEAGWDFNKTIDFAVPAGMKTREMQATVMAQNLQSIGLKVKINKYDLPTILQKGAKHEFDILLIGIPFQLDPDRSAFFQTGAPYNFAGYSNPEVDALLDKGKKEADPAKRHEIYAQLVEKLQQDLPVANLMSSTAPGAVSKKVKNAVPKDLGMFYNIQDWDIEQ
ncbi:ABC transporter substrate-binding protein [Bacillus salipaludis]|uniref:ABC transporter substrate-binding protein n=1 Tax=Bacillus salipaludis TaxID=2547811 RepID=UPI002E20C432|nr:ABC transporter substrate-binding protein [Bacillus salipaludis]